MEACFFVLWVFLLLFYHQLMDFLCLVSMIPHFTFWTFVRLVEAPARSDVFSRVPYELLVAAFWTSHVLFRPVRGRRSGYAW